MPTDLLLYVIGAFLTSLVIQYLVIDLSHKKGIFIDDNISDLPQKLHDTPTPRIGGLGIFIGCLFMFKLCSVGFGCEKKPEDVEIGLYIILSMIPSFVAGFLEDLFAKITPARRLLIMSVSAGMAIYLLNAFILDFHFFQVPISIGVVISVIAILGLINGTNLIDGFNGLSSGVSLVIFTTYFFISLKLGDNSIAYVSIICVATLLGFLIFNYPRGKIFLGDGGAYITGFLLAVISILLVKRNPNLSPWFVLVSLIFPVWEVIFSFTRRTLVHRLSPLHPDSKHIHQIIYRNITNENNPLTTLVIIPIIIAFNVAAYVFYNNSIALFFTALVFVFCYTCFYFYYSRKEIREKK
jgi:UDP-N-acetylmuramyl pentapeptide phosphotransferase/UDP-N-acetylglucosamine-1-phosphate transferase